MSCILYNKASYDALGRSPLFCSLWRARFTSYYDTPELAAEAFFNLNVRAYVDRYEGRYEEEREAALVSPHVEPVFAAFVAAERAGERPLALAKMFTLFKRIEYQCSDANNHNDIPDFWRLLWAKDWAGGEMVEYLESQYPPVRVEDAEEEPPPAATSDQDDWGAWAVAEIDFPEQRAQFVHDYASDEEMEAEKEGLAR